MSNKPLTPNDVDKRRVQEMPDPVIEAFNACIAAHWDGHMSCFTQEEVVAAIVTAMNVDRSVIFSSRYLDVERIYESVGWLVRYDQPGYNESYAATFTFTRGV